MDSQRREDLKRLFEQAVALPAEDRNAFLDENCADDPEARAELSSLLTVADQAEPFFDDLGDAVISLPSISDEEFADVAEHESMVDKTVRQYRIEERIGSGGMGIVYRAHDTRLERTVALKFLPRHVVADEEAAERFLVEARAAAALDHPNVCTVHEIRHDEEGRPFIAMAFCDGETLKQKLRRGALSADEAADYAAQIAAGLAAAHEHGIVHRDVKPGNVIVTPGGVAKVLDFGLAKLADVALTGTGVTLGTVAYMSPEQTRGEELDARTDLWSLGVVLHEMLTGRRPFRGERPGAVIHAIRHDDPEPPGVLQEGLPPALDELAERLLRKDPEERYPNAEAFLADLAPMAPSAARTVLAGRGPPTAKPAPPSLSMWFRQRKVLRTALVIVALAVATGGYLTWRANRVPSGPPALGGDGGKPTIAVLPCDNFSPDPEDAFLAAALHAQILLRLSKISALISVGRESVRYYRDNPTPISEIAVQLGVGFIGECSVRKEPGHEQIRLTFQLLDPSGAQVWGESYDADLTAGSLLEVESTVAQQVAAAIGATLTPEEEARIRERSTENSQAYELYLRGMLFLDRDDEASLLTAEHLLQQAVELDPEFAIALAQLSIVHSRDFWYRYDRSPERLGMARESAERALALDPDLPEAHHAMGNLFYRGYLDYERALEELEAARETRIDGQILLDIAAVRRRQGRTEEALSIQREAARIDPIAFRIARSTGQTLRLLRRFPEAQEQFERAVSLAPDQPAVYHELARLFVAWQGDTERARSVLQGAFDVGVDATRVDQSWIWLEILDRDFEAALDRLARPSWEPVVDANYVPKSLIYAQTYGLKGDRERAAAYYDSARVELEAEVRENSRDERLRSALGIALAGLGRKEEAIREGELAANMLPIEEEAVDGAVRVGELAQIYAMVGEPDLAIDQLELLLSIPSELSVPLLRIDPTWDPLRDHPRFQALLEG